MKRVNINDLWYKRLAAHDAGGGGPLSGISRGNREENMRICVIGAGRGPRELLGGACPISRIAPRAAPARPGRFAAMKWVNIKEG